MRPCDRQSNLKVMKYLQCNLTKDDYGNSIISEKCYKSISISDNGENNGDNDDNKSLDFMIIITFPPIAEM